MADMMGGPVAAAAQDAKRDGGCHASSKDTAQHQGRSHNTCSHALRSYASNPKGAQRVPVPKHLVDMKV